MGLNFLPALPHVLSWSWELLCMWHVLHTSAVCGKVSIARWETCGCECEVKVGHAE
jgi:hypothetical protein